MSGSFDLDHERRLYRLVEQGLEVERAKRAQWVAELGLASKREELELIERLGEADGGPAGFLESPLVRPRGGETDEDQGQVGPPVVPGFRIRRVLGEGGMGTVFLAEQLEPVRRPVALKVMRRLRFGADAVARFRSERQALARLRHPNIGSLYEAGETEGGRPFFAMEWIDGRPIHAFCDDHGLSIAERVELFVAVCRGVEHAHERLILHRDLKPENVLVQEGDQSPVPKIIDFGIAKALGPDQSRMTQQGVLGTPEYLCPESLHDPTRPLDVRSDVYGLGVLLHELLSGVRPYEEDETGLAGLIRRIEDGSAPGPAAAFSGVSSEMRRSIARRRGTTPPGLDEALRGEPDWIVRRAIRRDPDDRYRTAAELRADLERHLQHEPVLAAPPGALYRLRKFVRRNRLAVVAVVGVVSALLLGVLGTSVGLLRARTQAAAAEQALAESEVLVGFLNELFTDVDPRRLQGRDATARDLLDQGAERIDDELAEQPRARARLLRSIGDIYVQLGLHDEGEPLLERALQVHESMEPEDVDLGELAVLHHSRAILAYEQGRLQDAVTRYQRAIEEPTTLDAEVQARMRHNLGISLYRLGRREEALVEYLEALRVRREVLPNDHPDLANSHEAIGVYEMFTKLDYAAAERHHRLAAEIREQAFGPEHPYVAASLNNLCLVGRRQAEFARVDEDCHRAVEIQRAVYGDAHTSTARSLTTLAGWYTEQGRFEEGRTFALEGVAVQERATGPRSRQVADRLVEAWKAAWLEGRWDLAGEAAGRMLDIRTELLGHESVPAGSARAFLGLAQWKSGELESAERTLRSALEILGASDSAADTMWPIWLGLAGAIIDREDPETRAIDLHQAKEFLNLFEERIVDVYAPGHVMRVAAEREWVRLEATVSGGPRRAGNS